jgi:hypothetical protein
MDKIDTLVINKSTFSEKNRPDSSYRFTGYYYIYEFADGNRKLLPCNKEDANAIGGVGVCGCYIKFEDAIIGERLSKYGDAFTEEEKEQENTFNQHRIDESKKVLEFYKALPAKLTEKNVQQIHMDYIMENMFKKEK